MSQKNNYLFLLIIKHVLIRKDYKILVYESKETENAVKMLFLLDYS